MIVQMGRINHIDIESISGELGPKPAWNTLSAAPYLSQNNPAKDSL